MKLVILCLLLAGCGGCGQSGNDNNHGLGWHFDEEGPTGLRVRYADELSPRLENLEASYRKVSACTDTDHRGPLIIFTRQFETHENHDAITYLDNGTIVVSPDLAAVGETFELIRHEMVHYILWKSGTENSKNAAHESAFFASC